MEIAGRIEEEQIFSRIFIKGYNEKNVLNFLDEVTSAYARFRKEKRELDEKASDYNILYATDCNGCFSKAEEYIELIKEGMKSEMKIFKRFCATNKKKFPYIGGEIVELSALDHSDLGASYVQKLLPFSEQELTTHPKLRELSNEIIRFTNEMSECIHLCMRTMEDEVKIRKDYPRVRSIYDRTINLFMATRMSFIDLLPCPDSIEELKYPLTREMLSIPETEKWNEILAKHYHKMNPDELVIHYIQLTKYKEKHAIIPTSIEQKLWGNDLAKIERVRLAIQYFDELNPKGNQDKETGNFKLKGSSVAKLMHWALRGTDAKMNDFVGYFNETYKGKYQKIEYATVWTAYSGLKANEKDKCVFEFENFLNQKGKTVKKFA